MLWRSRGLLAARPSGLGRGCLSNRAGLWRSVAARIASQIRSRVSSGLASCGSRRQIGGICPDAKVNNTPDKSGIRRVSVDTFKSMISFFAFSSSCFVGSSLVSGAFVCSGSGEGLSSAFLPASVDCHLWPVLREYEAGRQGRGDAKDADENGDRRT